MSFVVHWALLFFIIYYKCHEVVSKCADEEFLCKDGTCIKDHFKCDGLQDCPDNEDELNCSRVACDPRFYFSCHDGSDCIISMFVCDGQTDCHDHSDEKNCPASATNVVCDKNEFACVSIKECVDAKWVCDGDADCQDGSDETTGCDGTHQCTDGFLCSNKHCIFKEFHCDGSNDCGDNSDEQHCQNISKVHYPVEKCHPELGLFLCKDKVGCIHVTEVCDGTPLCFDNSDEIRCSEKKPDCKKYGCEFDCRPAPNNGTFCLCQEGYKLDETLKKCIDIDECENFGSCGQKCKNTIGSFQCSCDSGFKLQTDRRTCKAKGDDGLLIFSSSTLIRGRYLNSNESFTVASNLDQVTGVSHSGKHIFWTNVNMGEETIVRSNEDGTNREVVVDAGLGLPEDLEVDYITGNIYFTDSQLKRIGVCTATGLHCAVLVNKNIDLPRAIALLPRSGVMFWSDWGETPMIATAFMNGQNSRPLVEKDIHWPNGIALDAYNNRLYWVDAKLKSVESVRLDGTHREVILKGIIQHPFAITVFENTLYWSDWDAKEVQSCDKFTGKNQMILHKERKNFIYGVHIYHPALHPRVNDPCAAAPCTGICLLAPNDTYTCACSENYNLAADLHTCRAIQKNSQIIIANGQKLYLVSHQTLGKQEVNEIVLNDIETISAVAYNSLMGTVLIAASTNVFEYNLSTKEMKKVIYHKLGKINSMAYDPYTNNLYISDDERRVVELWSLTKNEFKVLHKYPLDHTPVNIALSPQKRALFVSVRGPKNEIHITRMEMGGSVNVSTTIVSTSVEGLESHLFYSADQNRLFWTNPFFQALESVLEDGTDRQILHIAHGEPISLISTGKTVYWTERNAKKLFWFSEPGERFMDLGLSTKYPAFLDVVTSLTSKNLHTCQKNNGGCSHICLADRTSYSCICPSGLHLSDDKTKCIPQIHCTDDEFKCELDDICIPRIDRCDKHKDCKSGEDELFCHIGNCTKDEFACANGQCVPQRMRCDFEAQCSDNSDELGCSHKCLSGEFKCSSGECISSVWRCDYGKDCKDGSDEIGCPAVTCSFDEFPCRSGTCIPAPWECDSDIDCPDGEDEANCRTDNCRTGEFACANGRCIDSKMTCDGLNDCGDGSDEEAVKCKISEIGLPVICDLDEFLCSTINAICVKESSRCDGKPDCPHGEDETDCANCHKTEFMCANKKCVFSQWLCDGHDDCGDNSDESLIRCNTSSDSIMSLHPPCNDYQCKSGQCIPFYLVCDTHNNCADGSDEGGSCGTACQETRCQGKCYETPIGSRCVCADGYYLGSDGNTCIDINECNLDQCSQLCINTLGSFECKCFNEYLLKNDRVTCKANGSYEYIVAGGDDLKTISQSLLHVNQILHEPGAHIIGIDVDSHKGVVYWSSGTMDNINVIKIDQKSRSFISDVGRPTKLSLDWITNNVFFINNNIPNHIEVCNVGERKCARILRAEQGAVITNLVIDPPSGTLFYSKAIPSGLHRPYSKIMKYSFKTRNSTTIVSDHLTWVSSLIVDPFKKHLYWSDLHAQVIERASFDGTQRQVVLKDEVHRPEGLMLFEDALYWLSKGSGELKKCYITGERKGICKVEHLHLFEAAFLVINHRARQPLVANPCENNVCDPTSLCLKSSDGPICVCEDGTIISQNLNCDYFNSAARLLYDYSERSESDISRRDTVNDNSRRSLSSVSSTMLTIFLTVIVMIGIMAGYVYYRRKSTPLVLETFHFRNPAFGLSFDDFHPNHQLTPGQHEYVNHAALVQQQAGEKMGVTLCQKDMPSIDTKYGNEYSSCESCNSSDHYEDIDMKAQLIV